MHCIFIEEINIQYCKQSHQKSMFKLGITPTKSAMKIRVQIQSAIDAISYRLILKHCYEQRRFHLKAS